MKMKTKNKEVNILPKIKNIVALTNELNGKNLNEVYFKGSSQNDIGTLCLIIKEFATNDDGGRTFSEIDEVYEFLDDYIMETKKTIANIYEEIASEINELGFFNTKMKQEELQVSLVSNLNINMDTIVEEIVKKVSDETSNRERIYRVQSLDWIDLINEIKPYCFKYGIRPNEFYELTYKDAVEYVNQNVLRTTEEHKRNIQLYEAFGNKIIGALQFSSKKNKNISLIKDVYDELFKEELEAHNKNNQIQSVEEQIKNLRSWGSVKSKPKSERG